MGLWDNIKEQLAEKFGNLAAEHPETAKRLVGIASAYPAQTEWVASLFSSQATDAANLVRFLHEDTPHLQAAAAARKEADPMFAQIYDLVRQGAQEQIETQMNTHIPQEWQQAAQGAGVPVDELVTRMKANGADKIAFAVTSSVVEELPSMAWYGGSIARDTLDDAVARTWKQPEKSMREDFTGWISTMVGNVVALISTLVQDTSMDSLKERGTQHVLADAAARAENIAVKTGRQLTENYNMPATYAAEIMTGIYTELKTRADVDLVITDEEKAALRERFLTQLSAAPQTAPQAPAAPETTRPAVTSVAPYAGMLTAQGLQQAAAETAPAEAEGAAVQEAAPARPPIAPGRGNPFRRQGAAETTPAETEGAHPPIAPGRGNPFKRQAAAETEPGASPPSAEENNSTVATVAIAPYAGLLTVQAWQDSVKPVAAATPDAGQTHENPSWGRIAGQFVSDTVVGNNEFAYPEILAAPLGALGLNSAVDQGKFRGAVGLSWSEEGIATAIKNYFPHVTPQDFNADKNGNVFVTLPNQETGQKDQYYLNASGISLQDTSRLLAETAMFIPLFGWAGRAVRGAELGLQGTRALIMINSARAMTALAGDMSLDRLANAWGGGEDISVERLGESVMSALFIAPTAELPGRFVGRISNKILEGKPLSALERTQAQIAGLDVGKFTEELLEATRARLTNLARERGVAVPATLAGSAAAAEPLRAGTPIPNADVDPSQSIRPGKTPTTHGAGTPEAVLPMP